MRHFLLAAVLVACASLSYGGDNGSGDWQHGGDHDNSRLLKLYDAQGKLVGPLVSYDADDGVMLQINGALVFVEIVRQSSPDGTQASASQFVWAASGEIFYPSANCSGSPMIFYYYGPGRPSMAVRDSSGVTVYVAPDSFSAPVTVASAQQSPNLTQCGPFSNTLSGWIPESTYSLTQHYPEPLRVGF